MQQVIYLESIKKMPLMDLPVRSVYIKIDEEGVLISPGSCLTEEQLKALGNVKHIVATNLFHCAGIKKAAALYPEAKLWAPLGGKKLKPKINWTHELGVDKWPFESQLPMILIGGMPKINESVFVHKESKSLIVADLCFNMTEADGIGAWLILNFFGTYKKLGVSKFFMKFLEDEPAFKNSLKKLFSHEFENIAISHGNIVNGDAKNRLSLALKERIGNFE